MKFKFPKKITIGCTEFKIRYNPDIGGASFCYPTQNEKAVIEIGTIYLKTNPLDFLGSVVHEFTEILLLEEDARVRRNGDGTILFHYDHAVHADVCCRLAGILKKFIK